MLDIRHVGLRISRSEYFLPYLGCVLVCQIINDRACKILKINRKNVLVMLKSEETVSGTTFET